MWGLRADEVRSRQFFNLENGLPVGELRQAVWQCLAGKESPPVAVDAVNRRGKAIRCGVTCTPLLAPGKDPRGVIMLMEEAGPEQPR